MLLLLATLLGYTAMLPGLVRSRMPWAEKLLALTAFASVFLSGRIQSDNRYLAAGWPFATFMATRRAAARNVLFGLCLAGYVLFALLNVSGPLAP